MTTDPSDTDSTAAWEQLMGNNIVMKRVDLGHVFDVRPVDHDARQSGKQVEGEMNDYVLIDLDCFFFHDDTDNGTNLISNEIVLKQMSKKSPDRKIFASLMEAKDLLIQLGHGDFPSLELACRFLSVGDDAIIRCHSKFAHPYGRKGSCEDRMDLPPDTEVFYRIRVRSIILFGNAQSVGFRLKFAKQLKANGNDAYKYEWIGENGGFGKTKSLKAYEDAIQEFISILQDNKAEGDAEKSQEIRKQVNPLLVDCYSNIAAVHLRDKDYVKAKESAGHAIQIDPDNVKALCRAAKASMLSGAFEECKLALEAAKELDQGNSDVQRLGAEFLRRRKAYNMKEKEMYAKMMRKDNPGKTSNECGNEVDDKTVDDGSLSESKKIVQSQAWSWAIFIGPFLGILCAYLVGKLKGMSRS
jgi:tetratricopeptide (TPR) repeat protein